MVPNSQLINLCLGLTIYNQPAWSAGHFNQRDSIGVHLVFQDESDLVSGLQGTDKSDRKHQGWVRLGKTQKTQITAYEGSMSYPNASLQLRKFCHLSPPQQKNIPQLPYLPQKHRADEGLLSQGQHWAVHVTFSHSLTIRKGHSGQLFTYNRGRLFHFAAANPATGWPVWPADCRICFSHPIPAAGCFLQDTRLGCQRAQSLTGLREHLHMCFLYQIKCRLC